MKSISTTGVDMHGAPELNMPDLKKSSVPNLKRGMAILEYLASGQHSATIAELSELLGYPSACVFRITQGLAELSYR